MNDNHDILEFGKTLLETEDLDPVYCAAVRSKASRAHLRNFIFWYCCYYHSGVAAHLAERGPEIWFNGEDRDREMERNRPFGRRQESQFLSWMAAKRLTPFWIILQTTSVYQLDEVMWKAQEIPTWGPWTAWKFADMMERIVGTPLRFDIYSTRFFHTDPKKAATTLAGELWAREAKWENAVEWLVEKIQDFPAPPQYERPCSYQEAHNILCKWKAWRRKHYFIGKDIVSLRIGLEKWSTISPLASSMLEACPKIPEHLKEKYCG